MSNQKFFCVGCGFGNDTNLGQKPSICQKCGMNFSFAKYSAAPPVQNPQIIYQEPPRRQTKARYVEIEEEDEYFEEIDEKSLAAAIKIDSGRPIRGVRLEDALNNSAPRDDFARQTGPILNNEQILAALKSSNDKKWNCPDGADLA